VSIVDARRFDPTEIESDVCVIGTGAAGISIARRLAAAGMHVALVESGGLRPDAETQALYDLESRGYPVRENFMSRARYFGGSCNLWAGRSMRVSARDLSPRPWVGLEGWPIARDDIEAYETEAASALRLPALAAFDPGAHEALLSSAERALFDADDVAPAVSLWARRPRRFADARPELRRSDRIRVFLHLSVTQLLIEPGEDGVRAAAAATLEGNAKTIRARHFVLACGGIENARLLLCSRERFPAGIGNAHDQVGRCYMDHPRAVFGRVTLRDPRALSAIAGAPLRDGRVQVGIGLSGRLREEEGLLDPYATFEPEVSQYAAESYQTFVQTMKVLLRRGYAGKRRDWRAGSLERIPGMVYLLTPRELAPHALYRVSHALRRRLGRVGGPRRVVVYFCEQPPVPESRVTLGTARDALGMNRVVLDWRVGDGVVRSVRRLEGVLADRLRRSGLGDLEPGEGEPRFTDASHHMGTTRMSASPRTGVVDGDCRVHGIPNLWVAGSSVFPSGGHKNPTLTLVALALRLADRLAERPG